MQPKFSIIKVLLLILFLFNGNSKVYSQSNEYYTPIEITLPEKRPLVNCVEVDSYGKAWIGTSQYLAHSTNQNTTVTINDDEKEALEINQIVILPNDQDMWLGTYTGGPQIFVDGKRLISITARGKRNRMAFEGLVTAMAIDKNNRNLYWGTSKGAIFKYNYQKGKLKEIKSPSDSNIKSLCINDKDKLLISSPEGLFINSGLFSSWKKISSMRYINKVAINNTIKQVSEDDSKGDVFWAIGKDGNGDAQLIKIINDAIEPQKISCIDKDSSVTFNDFDFDFDIEGRIWITTNQGIIIHSITSGSSHWYLSEEESIEDLNCIAIAEDQTAWISAKGDRQGLYKIEFQKQDSCGLYGKRRHSIVFKTNTSEFENGDVANKLLFDMSKYLKRNQEVRFKFMSRSSVKWLAEKRVEIIHEKLRRYEITETSDLFYRIEPNAAAIDIIFICPTDNL